MGQGKGQRGDRAREGGTGQGGGAQGRRYAGWGEGRTVPVDADTSTGLCLPAPNLGFLHTLMLTGKKSGLSRDLSLEAQNV